MVKRRTIIVVVKAPGGKKVPKVIEVVEKVGRKPSDGRK